MDLLSFVFGQHLERSSSRKNKKIEIVEHLGRKLLLVNGIQQTGPYVNSLFQNGLRYFASKNRKSPKKIAVLGVGGGGVLFQFKLRYPESSVTAVDYDAEIIRLGKKYFGFTELSRTNFIVADARTFIEQERNKGIYDLVIVDLYVGNDVPDFVTTEKFLRGIKGILTPTGSVMINYFSFENQQKKSRFLLDKLSKIYQSVISKPNKRNIFFFCR